MIVAVHMNNEITRWIRWQQRKVILGVVAECLCITFIPLAIICLDCDPVCAPMSHLAKVSVQVELSKSAPHFKAHRVCVWSVCPSNLWLSILTLSPRTSTLPLTQSKR